MRVVPILLLMALLVPGPAEAEERSPSEALLAAAKACPVSLREAMGVAHGADHRPVDGALLLDTEGKLLLRCTVRLVEKEAARFETWTGHVHGAGWVPTAAPLEGAAAADAAKRWAWIEGSDVLRFALMSAVPSSGAKGPADVVLSVAAGRPGKDGKATATLRVGVGKEVRGLRFASATTTFKRVAAPAAPAATTYDAGVLPALPSEGTWFNTDGASPTLAGWRGVPVLVVITDPG